MTVKQQYIFIGVGFLLMTIFAPLLAAFTVFWAFQMLFTHFIVSHIVKHWKKIAIWYFSAFYVIMFIVIVFSVLSRPANSLAELLR